MVAALRELREETGMRSVVLLGTLDGWLDYDFPTEVRSQMSSTWLRFRGQTQKWYVCKREGCACVDGMACIVCCWHRVRACYALVWPCVYSLTCFTSMRHHNRFLAHFYGDVGEIDLTHGGKPEFTEYTWLPIEQLPLDVVHFKRGVYEQVASEFGPRIARWLQEQEARRRSGA